MKKKHSRFILKNFIKFSFSYLVIINFILPSIKIEEGKAKTVIKNERIKSLERKKKILTHIQKQFHHNLKR